MLGQYRADHIGSFLRPRELLEERHKLPGDSERLRAIEDQSIQHVLDKQKEIGLRIFTDGELRRYNFMSDFVEGVEGFNLNDNFMRAWNDRSSGAEVLPVRGTVISKLRAVRPLTVHELTFLKQHSPGDIKITLPSATQFPAISFKRGVTDKVYKDHSELLWDIVAIMRTELARLSSEGVKYIQIDAPRYSYYIDPKWREWIRSEVRMDPEDALDEAIEADNACIDAARRPGVTIGIHLCRGNNRSHWYAQGGYDSIAQKLFGKLAVDRFLLEYDDVRSGSFEPLRFVPRDKMVVLGLISSKLPQMENIELLVKRIHEAAKYIPLENLAVSPQCGFASVMEGNRISEDDQWAKLRLVVETASRVWG